LGEEEFKNLASVGGIAQPLLLPISNKYKDFFNFKNITKGHLNLILGIEFYFKRLEKYMIIILSDKFPKFKNLLEKIYELEQMNSADKDEDIHLRIAKEGLDVLDNVFAKIEQLREEINLLIAEIATDKEIIDYTNMSPKELGSLLNGLL